MALIGITGNVTLPTGFHIGIKSATLHMSIVAVDVTTTADGGNQKMLGGLRRASGSVVGVPLGGAGNNPGFAAWPSTSTAYTSAAMTVTLQTGDTYTFNAIVTNIRYSFTYAGAAVLTFDYVSDGAITEANWS